MNWFGHKDYLTTPLLHPRLVFRQTQLARQLNKLVYKHKQEVGGRWEWRWYWCRKTEVWNAKTRWDLDLPLCHPSHSSFLLVPLQWTSLEERYTGNSGKEFFPIT